MTTPKTLALIKLSKLIKEAYLGPLDALATSRSAGRETPSVVKDMAADLYSNSNARLRGRMGQRAMVYR